jgi:transcriptional regulator with XRE-family HTH domain
MKYTQSKDKDLEILGSKIKAFREKKGVGIDTFTRQADLSKYYYYRVEYGNANPSILQLKKIASALNVKVKDLIDF